MAKKTPNHHRATEEERREKDHMDVFRRLARVVNMHGTPGPRKPHKN